MDNKDFIRALPNPNIVDKHRWSSTSRDSSIARHCDHSPGFVLISSIPLHNNRFRQNGNEQQRFPQVQCSVPHPMRATHYRYIFDGFTNQSPKPQIMVRWQQLIPQEFFLWLYWSDDKRLQLDLHWRAYYAPCEPKKSLCN